MTSESSPNHPPGLIRHVAEAMEAPKSPPGPPLSSLPDRETVIGPRPLPLPVPMSAFSTRRSRIWRKPGCTHLTTTRLYGGNYVCEVCRCQGSFGWLYRCTQDRDLMIQEAKDDGHQVAYDDFGESLMQMVDPPKRGPQARLERFSFLKELTSEEMANYLPGQIATILEQRENVHKAIIKDRVKMDNERMLSKTRRPSAGPSFDTKRVWVPLEANECQHKVCHSCRPSFMDRSYLSLDGVVNGDIPPSAAVGFGFSLMRARPVIDPEIVKNIGCRAVPIPRFGRYFSATPTTPSSTWSVMDLIDEHLEMPANDGTLDSPLSPSSSVVPKDGTHSMPLPHRPPFTSAKALRIFQSGAAGLSEQPTPVTPAGASPDPRKAEDLLIRPPWTPPNSPAEGAAGKPAHIDEQLIGSARYSAFNGRSPMSIRTNLQVRTAIFASVPPSELAAGANSEDHVGYLAEEHCDDRIASATPLPRAVGEELSPAESGESAMQEEEREGGSFGAAPLDVPGGVAVTEEGVEYGEADVVTQV